MGRRHLSNLMSTELKISELELWISRSMSIEETEQLIRNREILKLCARSLRSERNFIGSNPAGICLKEED